MVKAVQKRRRYRSIAAALWPFVLLALLAVAFFPRVETGNIARAKAEAETVLALVGDAVDQAIQRFEPLPGIIAGDPILLNLLRQTDNQGVVPFVNEKLRLLSLTIGASDIFVMDRSGLTVASSNYREPDTFLGRNFAFRPYFGRALAGEPSQFHGLGTTSDERGFFFSAPITNGIEIVGVIVIKMTVEEIEQSWERSDRVIMVADADGITFLASDPLYRLRALAPLAVDTLTRIERTRQFPVDTISPIPFSASVIREAGVEVVLGSEPDETRFLSVSLPLTLPGWHAIVLTPMEAVRTQSIRAMTIPLLVAAIGLLIVYVLRQRWMGLMERAQLERRQRTELERQVRERTTDLLKANRNLRNEVAERQAAEDKLLTTQKSLLQASKLAALGQMSAALSHEINQPLAAIISYADNAETYLERNRIGEVRSNISSISQMANRMANITRTLRSFARRPGEALGPVPINETIDETIVIVAPQLREREAVLEFDPAMPEVWVWAGRLRLQQVLVNLVTNALDAMGEAPDARIELRVEAADETVTLVVRDHGPGLSDDVLNQLFEAFYTTKDVGHGMGLGLSISYNIIEDFGGRLLAENHPEGGAVFRVELKRHWPDGQGRQT
ncbi:C4-dicarboxylate transport sensor protein DctB [Pontivivens insulae]|uniref:C4-dicarboxylate transport sensor protein DctB n=2 Tax=Pontivivens insulae TaxID=1639689 RepID=A0A2R8A6R7_9RHOB|nr:two-component system C4-dicarboxylate transport sensor histidine kinase DctB [Pontivivens insulae]SPF27924.1 C4-dicarboxylate transport sensor protein DctB [Pontivivens insulae]